MADHGVNRRKSHNARKKQRIGKMKTAIWKKQTKDHRNNLFNFWNDKAMK